ncbi:uncharacterized protein [Dermacentor albipictus]|uniref:uncharacterized protein n=1 Tax=Dermacentor albipictus TaxID=60249 RepID=UPI0031FBB80A
MAREACVLAAVMDPYTQRGQLPKLPPDYQSYAAADGPLTMDDVFEHLAHALDRCRTPDILVMDDFNAHSVLWGPREGDDRGTRLIEFAAAAGLVVLNDASSPPTALAKYRREVARAKEEADREVCDRCSRRSLFQAPFRLAFGDSRSHITLPPLTRPDGGRTIRRHKAEGTPVVLISLDFRGAFHSVWHPLVTKYFRDRGCPANLVGLLGSFLEGRTVEYASHAGSVSAETSIGSPQGSPISPLLWNVVVDGLLRLPMPPGVRVQAYADDTIVLVPGKNRARVMEAAAEAMRRIEQWTIDCKLALNGDKTFCVLFSFGKGGMEKSHPTIRLQGSTRGMPFRSSVKLLGVVVDRRLSFFEHAEHLQRKAETLAIKSLSFMRMHTAVDSALRRRLYRQVLLPAVAYASPIWWSSSPDCRLKARMTTVQRTMLLAITGAYRTTRTAALQVLANQPPIGLELDRLNAEFALFRMRRAVTFGAHTFAPDEVQYPHDVWGAHPSEARGYPFARLEVAAARAWSSAPGTHVYTDGSHTSRSAGAAVVVLRPRGSIVAVRKFRLTVASSAYCAEVIALAEALNYLETHGWQPPAHSYVDNLSLLAALSSVVTRDARVASIKGALDRLQRRGALLLFHVSAHRGIFGNELAHLAAGSAAISGVDRRSHRSFRVVRAAFSAAVRVRWAVEWRGEHSDTELYKWVPDIAHIPRDFPPSRRLACLITVHGRFPYYFQRFRISQDARCPCGAPCRDVRHFFESCAKNVSDECDDECAGRR